MNKEIEPGMWVRFYRDGKMVVSVVMYIRKDPLDGRPVICTDIGEIEPDDVMEAR